MPAVPRVLRSLGRAAAIAVLATACSDRVGRGWDWKRMRSQPRYEPYGSSAFFADGKAMQSPPPGTVPRELAALGIGAARATDSSTATPAVLERGALRFHIFCAVCHGERGDGQSVVALNFAPPRPPSLLVPPASTLPASTLMAVITDGFGRMPSLAAELSVDDRRAVTAYVRALALGRVPIASPTAGGSASDSLGATNGSTR